MPRREQITLIKRLFVLVVVVLAALLAFGGDIASISRDELDAGLAAAIAWTLLVIGMGIALPRLAAERSAAVPGYLHEPPDEISPALAYDLASEGGYSPRVLSATLLDLIDRGYYDARASAGPELDLVLSVPKKRPAGGLEPHENATLGFFDRLLRHGPAGLSELKDRVPRRSDEWAGRWKELHKALAGAGEQQNRWDRDLVVARWIAAAVGVGGYVACLTLLEWSDTVVSAIVPLIIVGLGSFLLFPDASLRRQSPASRERHARWQAFARWTRDYPRLHDDHPATLKLWNRILVYAAAFGTADRVVAAADIPTPIAATDARSLAQILDVVNVVDVVDFAINFGDYLGVGTDVLQIAGDIGEGGLELVGGIADGF